MIILVDFVNFDLEIKVSLLNCVNILVYLLRYQVQQIGIKYNYMLNILEYKRKFYLLCYQYFLGIYLY